MVGRQLPFFSLIVPFWLIWAFAGFRGMIAIWPAILVCGVSFAVPQFLVSNYVNPWFVDIVASLVSMACLVGFLQVWQPKKIWTSPALRSHDESAATMPPPRPAGAKPTSSQVWASLMPWIIVCAVLLVWGTGWFKAFVNPYATWNYAVPELHNVINKMPPVVVKPTLEGAVFSFTWLSYTGSGMLIAAIIAGFFMGFCRYGWWWLMARRSKVCVFAPHHLVRRCWRSARSRGCPASATALSRLRRRRRALSLLRHAARLARRRAHWLRHGIEHPVRQSAEDPVSNT